MGVTLKTIFWIWLFIGLMPSLSIVAGSYAGVFKISEHETRLKDELERGEILVTHHAGIQIGPAVLQFFPRFGSAILATAGIVFLIFGLAILLHVPTPTVS